MEPATVKTAIWREERLFIVEDIPAEICGSCREHFYDEATTETLRRLTAEGFASADPVRVIQAQVFSLAGLMPAPEDRAPASPEDQVYADY
jgi:YgiT-type zinc finger domain-containing protein